MNDESGIDRLAEETAFGWGVSIAEAAEIIRKAFSDFGERLERLAEALRGIFEEVQEAVEAAPRRDRLRRTFRQRERDKQRAEIARFMQYRINRLRAVKRVYKPP